MKKNLKIFMLMLIALSAFGIGITKAYAAGENEFSLKAYNCGTFSEDEWTCLGPNGDYETPEIDVNHGTILPGQTIKMAIYFKPGEVSHTMMSPMVIYDQNMVTPLHLYDDLVLQMTGTTYDTTNPGPYPAKNTSPTGKLQTNWIVQYNDDAATHTICTIVEDNSGTAAQRKLIEQEGVLFYVYFVVKDDATPGDTISFTYDTSEIGTMLGNGAPITTSGADIDVYEEQSDDNTLQTLTVKNGNTTYPLTPEFVPGSKTNKTFTAYIPSNITSVNIDATKHEEHEVISGTGTKSNLQYGNNSYDISVLSQSGQTEIYTVKVYRLNSENTLSALTLSNVDFGTFSSNTTSYTATVPYTTDKTNVTATATAGNKATVTGTGNNKPLNVGSNTISVTVSPENCGSAYSNVPGNTCEEKTYTVTVTREAPSTISTLNDLTVDTNRVTGFTPGDPSKTYTLANVGYDKSSIIIGYVKGEEHETVTGDGTKTLNVGQNSFDVVVTAQDGTTKTTYTIKIYRKSNDATLKSLSVSSDPVGTLDPAFNKNTISYTYSVDADEDEVSISAEATHDNATIAYTGLTNGKVNPRQTSSVTITVTPEDTTKDKKIYTITFDVAKSTNGNLSEITVDNEPIDNFDPAITEYEITVPSNTESVVIGAELEDPRGEITGGTGAQALGYGENEIEITVQPEDPTAEPVTYTVTVIRSYKTDANLLDLKADGVTVPNFHSGDPDKTEYNVGNVASDKETINIDATLSDPSPDGATVTGIGDVSLSVGENKLPVVVTAHDGTTTKTYYVKVKRLNDAKNLETLTITSDPAGTWDKDFTPGETTYTYTTDPDETEVIIAATVPEGSGSTVVSGPGTYNPATTPEVTIVVRAEDNSEKHYIVNLVRAESSNANLSDLTIDGTTIDGFDPDITEYTINIPSDKDSITIGAELEDDRASFTGDGEKTNINYGPDNQYTITVVAEDETPKVYTINVTRAYKTDDTLTSLSVDGVPVPNFHSTDPDGTEYDLGKVASDKETVLIEAVLGDPDDATITGIGTKNIAIGDNSLPVTITAQDGETSRTYYIKIKRKNNDSSLAGLEVVADTQGSLDKDFDPTITEYTYTSDPDEDEVSINVTLPAGATVSGIDNPYNPQDGADVTITVTPEDGSAGVTIYTVHIVRGKATNANLDELDVIGYELDPDFDEDEDHYTVNVPADVDKVIITAHAADAPRASVSGTGEKDVEYGSQVFTVTVTADDPTVTKPYYVTVIRALNSNVKLDDLKVNGETIDGFDPDEPAYNYGTVGNDVTSLNIVGYPVADNATAETSENAGNLQVGENTITITVTAQNGDKGYYTVTVTREGSSNNYLDSLEVEGYDLDKDFDKDIEDYSITVPHDVDSVTVNAVAEDNENATVTIEGNDNLQPGENTITITVKAENGDEKTYTITVTKEEEPEDDEKITSQVRIIADGMIKDVVYKTLPEGLKDQCDNDNDKLFIYDMEDENEIDNNQQLGTGMIIKLIKNNRENDRDIIVVKGEVTGDGDIRINDVVRAVSAYVGAEELTGPWFEACDIATDGEIRINDVVSIVNLYVSE